MKPTINKLLMNIRPTFDAIIASIQIFWQRHRRLIGWAIGLTLLALLAAALFVWLWSRSRLFRTLVLIMAAGMVTNGNEVINWLTKQVQELQESRERGAPMTQEIVYDTDEAQGGEVLQGSKVEPEPLPI